jgi:hypothetical protein
MSTKTKSELLKEVELLQSQVEHYHRAYDNIIIIQESIVKAINQIKKEKKKAKKSENDLDLAKWEGYLQCLYKMSSWINMHDTGEMNEPEKLHKRT